jgi:poly-gamma-glutamate synthesis protein (capsule biosynthesis protein)
MNIKAAGAGRDAAQAAAPALLETRGTGRVVMFSFGLENSGIPSRWAASEDKPGINLLRELSDGTVRRIKDDVERVKRAGDIAVASIHWGGNWGYAIDQEAREFARGLIDQAGIDVIHGHSSHHLKGIEVYREKPILYGCGDFLDDYEGIGEYEEFRNDLVLMYFVSMERRTGKLGDLKMVPMQIKRFRLQRASGQDARWLGERMNRECAKLGTRVELRADNVLTLKWGGR